MWVGVNPINVNSILTNLIYARATRLTKKPHQHTNGGNILLGLKALNFSKHGLRGRPLLCHFKTVL